MSSGIVNLEEVVESWAYNAYAKTKSGKALKYEDIYMDINWSKVSFVPGKPSFNRNNSGPNDSATPKSHVIFKSVFRNESAVEQSHSLKTERETTATCTTSLMKGFTKGINVGLTLAAPGDVAEASVGFEKGFSIENAQESSDQRTLTWSTEGSLAVKPNSTLTAIMEVKEVQKSFTFKASVSIKGRVTVSIYNRKETDKASDLIMSVIGDIKEVLLSNRNIEAIRRVEDHVVIDITGKCDFKYGIEQHISCAPH